MPSTIQLKVIADTSAALSSLQSLDAIAKTLSGKNVVITATANAASALSTITELVNKATQLQSKPISLNVNATGLAKVTDQAIKAANAQARLNNSEAKLKKANNELAISNDKVKISANQLAMAQEKTKQVTEKSANARAAAEAEASAKIVVAQQKTAQSANATTASEANAYAAVAVAQERTAQSANNLAAANAKANPSATALAIAEERTAQSENRAKAAAESHAAATERKQAAETRAGETTERHAMQNERLAAAQNKAATSTRSLSSAFSGIGTMLASRAISSLMSSLGEAVSTMQEVDDALTEIQKVSKASDDVIEQLGENVYDTASKYGVSATQYLESVTSFTRAGYENAQEIAELSIKAQKVGDIEADVADQFILSADAAWKMGGNVSQLGMVLDEAVTIGDNYATSIEKMSDGLPTFASIAAQVGMSTEESLAALGTITTVTQETGTKAGTALRALILNITGDTTSAIEEGVNWTEEELTTLSDFLAKYAGDAMSEAAENGTIVNPMEAIRSLSQAYKDEIITEADLFALETELGGKIRANQLAALIENYDLYEEMLGRAESATGAADEEMEYAMESWSTKSQILKNSWAELVSTIVSSDGFEAIIESLTEAIDNLTNGLDGFSAVGDTISETIDTITSAVTAVSSLAGAVLNLFGTLDDSSVFGGFADKVGGLLSPVNTAIKLIQNLANLIQSISTFKDLGGSGFFGWLGYLSGNSDENFVPISTEVDGDGEAKGKLEDVKDTASTVPTSINIDITATDNASETINDVKNAASATPRAKGDRNFRGGLALVNEEGPELISDNGRAYIAGSGKPTITHISKGATILTASQTRRAIGNANTFKSAGAFKNGLGTNEMVEKAMQAVEEAVATKEYIDNTFYEKKLKAEEEAAATNYEKKLKAEADAVAKIERNDYTKTKVGQLIDENIADALPDTPTPSGSDDGSSSGGVAAKDYESILDNLDKQIELAENRGDYAKVIQLQEEAQNLIAEQVAGYLSKGYDETSDKVLDALNKGYGYKDDEEKAREELLNNLVDSIENLRDSIDSANDLAEKQQAVDDARETLENAKNQRTVRVFNPVTGQWEWVANASDVTKAEESLADAEKALYEEQLDQAIESLKNSDGDLSGLTIGSALTELISGADDTSEFANALGVLSGVADYSANDSALSTFTTTSDSHDTYYTFPNGITISDSQASTMTLKQLAQQLSLLSVT